jgi:diguanylate cyclase (GGDEF)-like protein
VEDRNSFVGFDISGNLWRGTGEGVRVLIHDNWLRYTHADGLAWDDTSVGGFWADDDGSVWIGTSHGLSHHRLVPGDQTTPGPALITEIRAADTSFGAGSEPKFTERDGAVTISFTSLSFKRERDLRFRYQLRGWDRGWTETGDWQVRYAGLKPGNYVFDVSSGTGDGHWSGAAARVPISVSGPWWSSSWFLTASGLFVLALIPLIWQLRVKNLQSRNRALENAVADRTAELLHLADHDHLTGLMNRAAFEKSWPNILGDGERRNSQTGLLFIDLDRFKEINDTLSHRVGDQFLQAIAERLSRAVRPDDAVFRIGGDEFTILMHKLSGPADATEAAERILSAIGAPLRIAGYDLTPSASIGVAIYPGDGADAETLMRAADAAMYRAKVAGGAKVQMADESDPLDLVRVAEKLQHALDAGWFEVHYQARIGHDGKFNGFEALARCNDPEHGPIPPSAFIPAAERSGLIVPLDAWVLDTVCRQIGDWERRGLGRIFVSVNVSAVEMARPDYARLVEECLGRHGVAPQQIELELTEGHMIDFEGEPVRQMRILARLGVHLSVDDFGTGYTAFSYLYRLPVDTVKIDRSLVETIDTDPIAGQLVRAILGVVRDLKLNCIAEGVETIAQREVLIAAGCEQMQGYLFARPQPACDVEAVIRGGSVSLDLARISKAAEMAVTLQPQ